jgi:hypothetical protein
MNEELARELQAMADEDQRVRKPPQGEEGRLVRVGISVEEQMDFARTDVGNTDRLADIVAEHGWPGRSLVGEEGAHHAWLLAQHADRQLDFQRRALQLLTEAVEAGEATPRQLAYLTDRVRMNEGREQVYGTQMGYDGPNAAPKPWPIEDAEHVDERRVAAGLEPLAEYVDSFRRR